MRWLPAFNFQGREAHVPLCSGTALLLLEVIHSESNADVSAPLAAGLLVDPLFCLWLWHQVESPEQVQTVQQLVNLVSPGRLRSQLAAVATGGATAPSPLIWDRARRVAMAAASQIASTQRSIRGAQGAPGVLDCLLRAAAGYIQCGIDPLAPPCISRAVSTWGEEAESFAWLEARSPLGRRLRKRVLAAWRKQAIDPQRILAAAMEQSRRLEALETTFRDELSAAKLAALKELAYGASHELNNPITNVAARAQLLAKGESSPDRRRMLSIIHQQALRAYQMIADLMLFAKPPAMQTERVRAAELVEEAVRAARHDAVAKGSEVVIRGRAASSLGWIDADRGQLGLALQSVCQNAIEAMGREGTLRISAAGGRGKHGQPELRLRVRDSGPGIPPEVLPHIFDPFFSGREAGRGLGFGLSKAWRIVTDHGGQITAESPAGGSAIFTICLPRYLPRRTSGQAA